MTQTTVDLIQTGVIAFLAFAILYWARTIRKHAENHKIHNWRPQAEYWRPEYPSDELPESGSIVEESTTYPDMRWTREENEGEPF